MESTISLANTGILTQQEYEDSNLVVDSRDDGMDRNAFLTLLTTQLQSQNPLDPMKNEEFVAQLAQFSQLEATYGMSASLEEMAKSQRSEQLMQGAVLVGKDVFAQTGLISTDGENASELHFDLPNGADQLEIGIFDASSNQRIRNMVIGPQQPGTAELAWDGKLSGGVSAPAGQYIVRASVTQSGVTAPITPKTYSSVKSIGWDASTAELNVDFGNNISLPISSVNRVGQF